MTYQHLSPPKISQGTINLYTFPRPDDCAEKVKVERERLRVCRHYMLCFPQGQSEGPLGVLQFIFGLLFGCPAVITLPMLEGNSSLCESWWEAEVPSLSRQKM